MPRWSEEQDDADIMEDAGYIDMCEVLERIELREALDEENLFFGDEDE